MTLRPVLLGGYAAKSCPRITHNQFDITIAEQPSVTSDDLQRLFDLGNSHEASVFAVWLERGTDVVDLGGLDGDKTAHIAATLEAMDAGRLVILAGRLPDDIAGGRTGKPDVLLRETAGVGYHPGDVKAHMVLNKSKTGGLASDLVQPALSYASEHELGLKYDDRDLLQLAHYWRMLQACGLEASSPYGAIVGTDVADVPLLAWYDLTEALFTTFSRSRGKTDRSSLERYDHEHDFRVKVALVAQQRTGSPADPAPLVVPVGQSDCLDCSWAPVCVETLPDDDLSAALPAGKLSVREYLALQKIGIHTLDDLAEADLDVVLASEYAEETAHQWGRKARLAKARIATELTLADQEIRLKPGAAFDIPRAAVEIDLDVEWDRAGRVYLWGALVTQDGQNEFVSFVDFAMDDEAAELTLALRCFDWLASTHPDALVYHYSGAERTQAKRVLGERLDSYAGTSGDFKNWVDLLPIVREGFDSRSGVGLKIVATSGAGFSWRDEDPGGLQSQQWLEDVRGADIAAGQRILDYNEDDVRATLAVRIWLSNIDSLGRLSIK